MSAINVDTIRSRTGTAPQLDKGVEVTVGVAITGSGGVNVSGFATAGGFVGDITGDVTGNVTGNINSSSASGISTVGILTSYTSVTAGDVVLNASDGTVTATSFSGDGGSLTGLPAGFNWVDGSLF